MIFAAEFSTAAVTVIWPADNWASCAASATDLFRLPRPRPAVLASERPYALSRPMGTSAVLIAAGLGHPRRRFDISCLLHCINGPPKGPGLRPNWNLDEPHA